MIITVNTVLLIAAFVLFVVAAIRRPDQAARVDLIAAGLAVWVLSMLIAVHLR